MVRSADPNYGDGLLINSVGFHRRWRSGHSNCYTHQPDDSKSYRLTVQPSHGLKTATLRHKSPGQLLATDDATGKLFFPSPASGAVEAPQSAIVPHKSIVTP
ncbi:hypothetical protein VTN00DRAFT_1770 [Thermoascus crustaceus]|uniref:uncharacterized protein n=1 Tax=Thermoascus crustaceus TaxID=5088 RepID=UPI0037422FE7